MSDLGQALVKSGQKLLIWNRGREAMHVLLKNAELISDAKGYNVYSKQGGLSQALKDFNRIRPTNIAKQPPGPDGVKFYYGTAGDVSVTLRVIPKTKEPIVTMTVSKKATDFRKGNFFKVYYK